MIKHSNPVYFAKITSQRNIGILPKNLPKQLKLFKFPASVFCCLLFLQHLRQTQDETILSKKSDTKKLLVLYPCVIQTGFMSKIIIGTYKIFSRMCERPNGPSSRMGELQKIICTCYFKYYWIYKYFMIFFLE